MTPVGNLQHLGLTDEQILLTAWATHPARLARIAWNALTGKETSATEKLIRERVKRARRRLTGRRKSETIAGSTEPVG
jgi:hypothetical protein